ncbi:hypothetical protein CTAYLR_007067 [Chrysophaeum taylorii]|uniref:Chloride channel protein n=1 Tax=Chrysophaeum taylorii TaxID=2483200 RepID=A0AAD7UL31_9STRA|nr:hypothetical protein CTAYLR_007067 [Chrysophaeum taylorii]
MKRTTLIGAAVSVALCCALNSNSNSNSNSARLLRTRSLRATSERSDLYEIPGVEKVKNKGLPWWWKWVWGLPLTQGGEPGEPLQLGDSLRVFKANIEQIYGGGESFDGAPLAEGDIAGLADGTLYLGMHEYALRFGPVYKLCFGPKSFIVVSDHNVAKRVLRENSRCYDKGVLAEILEDIMGKGLIPADPVTWKQRRRAIVPAFHRRWLERMTTMFAEKTDELCARLAKTTEAVDVEERVGSLALDIIGSAVFNYEFGSVDRVSPVVQAAVDTLREAEHRSVTPAPYWKIPGATYVVPRQVAFRSNMNLLNAELNKCVAAALLDRNEADIEQLERRDYETMENPSLLRFLVDARGEQASNKQLRDDLMTMLIAGHETTASALTWCIFELAQQPDLLRRVREEVDEACGDSIPSSLADVESLQLVRLCVAESLRMYPQPPLLIRRALDFDSLPPIDDDHPETRLARATDLFIAVYTIHRSPRYWEHPDTFDPTRFLRPFKNPDIPNWAGFDPARWLGSSLYPNELASDFAFLPFGGGARKGMRRALSRFASWWHPEEPEFAEQETLDGTVDYSAAAELAGAARKRRRREEERVRYECAILVAVTVAVLGTGIELSISKLSAWKFSAVEIMTRHGMYLKAGAVLCGFAAFCGLIAGATVVVFEPRAKGSGIPEIKTYLNGVAVHRVIAERTLVAKFVGIVFSVSGGLLCGKEGPMVHIGAIVGAIVSQGRFETLARRMHAPRVASHKFLRCAAEKLELIAIGTACGVSSAFGSPVGGVLFMIEEALSSWKRRLFFRATFAATLNCFAIVLLLTRFRTRKGKWTKLKFRGMAVFHDFDDDVRDYDATGLLFLSVLVGALVGLWGAAFVYANKRLTIWRARFFNESSSSSSSSKTARFAEVLLVSLCTALAAYVPAVSFDWCRKIDNPAPDGLKTKYAKRFQCDDDEYNEFATLALSSLSDAIAALFHQAASHAFSVQALACFMVYASVFTCVTYGLSVPSGLFIPSILNGATFGRLFAVLVLPLVFPNDSMNNQGHKVRSLAVAGGIAGLAATTRMTVSIVMIFASTIDDGAHLVPILVASLASKLAGDIFNEGLYDVHIHLNHYRFMEDDPPEKEDRDDDDDDDDSRRNGSIQAHVASQSTLACVPCRNASYKALLEVLQTPHHAFPVLDDDTGIYLGLVSRDQLCVVLHQATPQPPSSLSTSSSSEGSWGQPPPPRLAAVDADTRDFFPHFPRRGDLPPLSAVGEDAVLDLSPFVNRSALVVTPETNARYVWRLFRDLGLRHLPVVDSKRRVVGIVTRKDLLHAYDEPPRARKPLPPVVIDHSDISYTIDTGRGSGGSTSSRGINLAPHSTGIV